MENLCHRENEYMVFLTVEVAKRIMKGDPLTDYERRNGGIFKQPAHNIDLPAFDISWVEGQVVLTPNGDKPAFKREVFDLMNKIKDFMEELEKEMSKAVYIGHRGDWIVDWRARTLTFNGEDLGRDLICRMRWADGKPNIDLEPYAEVCCFFTEDFDALSKIIKDAETKLSR